LTKQTQTPKTESVVKVYNGTPTKVLQEMDFGKFYYHVHGDQILAPIRADITLFEKMGHIYKMYSGKEKGEGEEGKDHAVFKFIVTAAGYVHLNKVPGISILTPQQIVVDGQVRSNPHIERNPRTKAIENVNIRKLGIGYSPAGNVVVVDKTLFYNVYTYFIQSIQAKMKRKKWGKDEKAFPNAAKYGIEQERPKGEGRWAFFATEPPLGLWVNYDDDAIIDCLEEHTQRQRFGDRIAQKIVERNIFKDHPAIGISQVKGIDGGAKGWLASATVYGWRNEMKPKDMTDIVKQTEEGAATAEFDIRAETLDGTEPEEERAALAEVAGDEKDDGMRTPREPGEDDPITNKGSK